MSDPNRPTPCGKCEVLDRLHKSMETHAPFGTPRGSGCTSADSIALLSALEDALGKWSDDLRDAGEQYVHAKNASYAISCALADLDWFRSRDTKES